MNKNEMKFAALGGGQSVGASCYYLKLGASHILLDCGVGINQGMYYAPDLHFLMREGLVESLNQISRVYISHAHLDHMGHVFNYAAEFLTPTIYMTEVTRELTGLQLKKTVKASRNRRSPDIEYLSEKRVSCVSFRQELPCGDYTASFWEAGHIPGAMMTLFNFDNRRILYTGDYSLNPTSWTSGCQLPRENIDVLIMCGLHARHPFVLQKNKDIDGIIRKIYNSLRINQSVYCAAFQLSKGIELMRRIETSRCKDFPIYLDDRIYEVVKSMERLNIPGPGQNVLPLSLNKRDSVHIIIGASPYPPPGRYRVVPADFTLHDNFNETISFIEKVNPKVAFIVHSPPARYDKGTVADAIGKNPDCQTVCVFPETGRVYNFENFFV